MTVTETILTKEKVQVAMRINPDVLEQLNAPTLSVLDSPITSHLLMQLHSYIFTRRVADCDVRYPATWWDAVKARWFPQWALMRWPICEHVVTFTAHHDYPLLKIATHEPQLRVMRYERDDTPYGPTA